MSLSAFVVELFELSGMSKEDFCQKLNIDTKQFAEIEAGTNGNSASVKTLIKAISISLFSRKPITDEDDAIQTKLTQAQAIIITVGESEHLADHEQTCLSMASDLVDDARQRL